MAYKFVQGLDYGPRKGTLGISLHMSEGYDGLPAYLAQKSGETRSQWAQRVSGVSCHVAILSTGEVVQMLKWGSACGNLNPADRADEYGYYGGSYLRAVLGSGWTDPNAWTVSAELAGFRAKGPTEKQVTATIKWGLEMRAMFPTIRGATGHHDQSPKGCPGTTPAMKAIFAGLGGHGLFTEDQMYPSTVTRIPAADTLVTIPSGAVLYDNSDLKASTGNLTVKPGRDMPLVWSQTEPGARVVEYVDEAGVRSGRAYWATGTLVTKPAPVVPGPSLPPDAVACKPFSDAAVKTAVAADRLKARVVWT